MSYISIVMPTKDRAHLISKSIESVLNQTYRDWELIVIDVHSTDNTQEIIENFDDPRIKYFKLPNGTGPGTARDFGIKKAQNEIIVLADSDDINLPERLQLTAEAFKREDDIDLIYGLAQRIEEDKTQTQRPSQEFNKNLFFCYNFISHITVAYKKDVYLSTQGYDPKLRTSEDYDLLLTFAQKNYKFHFIDRTLVLQTIHPGSTLLETELERRKQNLAYVRKKHNLPTPKFKDVIKLVQNKDLRDFITNPKTQKFWFE